METRSIAIDGPAGAGKSTMAKALAKELGYIYVDTGAIYRSVGLYAQLHGIAPNDSIAVADMLQDVKIEMRYMDDGIQHMILCGEDVTTDIRKPEISMYASAVSAIPEVRAFLLGMQRQMAVEYNVIMDGRDIGTVVLPNAGLKIFLTADDTERADRRYKELILAGKNVTFEEVLSDMRERDRNDTTRAAAPLKPAENAIHVDTTGKDLDESTALLRNIVKENLGI